jgi:hypothetical protein
MSQYDIMDPLSPDSIPTKTYSTIFNCDEGFLTCFLRACEGIISLAMFIIFIKGYKTLSN